MDIYGEYYSWTQIIQCLWIGLALERSVLLIRRRNAFIFQID
nr:MAG TPA: hypothetical protein [Bacteriophage sp.]